MRIELHTPFSTREDALKLFLHDIPQGKQPCSYKLPDDDCDIWFPNVGSDPNVDVITNGWCNRRYNDETYIQEINLLYEDQNQGSRKPFRIVFGHYIDTGVKRFLGVYRSLDGKPEELNVNSDEGGFWYKRVSTVIEDTDKYLYWTPKDSFCKLLRKYLTDEYLQKIGEKSQASLVENRCGFSKTIMSDYYNGKKKPRSKCLYQLAFGLKLNAKETADLFRAAGEMITNNPMDSIFMEQINSGDYDVYKLIEKLKKANVNNIYKKFCD